MAAKGLLRGLPGPRLPSPAPLCSTLVVHAEAVEAARAGAAGPAEASGLAELFKVFADPTRIRILTALAAAELCVCDLGAALGLSQSATSHQLSLLRSARIVRSRREGKVVYYSLDDDHVGMLLTLGSEHRDEAGSLATRRAGAGAAR